MMSSAGRVVIGGGTGFVGSQLAAALERKGYQPVIVSRKRQGERQPTWKTLFAPAETGNRKMISWEDLNRDGLPSGTVGVVNTAGHNVLDPFWRWGDDLKKTIYDSRISTTGLLAKCVTEASTPPLAYVSMSGVGFYPPSTDNEQYTESSEGGQHDWLARLAKDWENAATLPKSVNTRSVVLRSGVVLGRQGGLVQQTILPFYLGLGGRMGPGDQVMPWIHVKDLADLIVHCLFNPECRGVYNAVAPDIVTNSKFVQTYASTMWRPAIFPIPSWVFNVIYGEERAAMVTQTQTVLPSRTLESGFEFRFPTIEEACEEFAHLSYIDSDSIPS